MKSKQKEKRLQTSCKGCAFAIYEGNTQTGCKFGRTEKFLERGELFEAYDEEKEFFVVKRLCNLARPTEHSTEDSEVAKARDSIKPSIFISVELDDATEGDFNNFFNTMKNIDYPNDKLSIVLSQPFEATKEQRKLGTKLLCDIKNLGIKAQVVFNIASSMREYDVFKKCEKNFSYYSFLSIKSTLHEGMLPYIDKVLNEDMDKVVFFRLNEIGFISSYAFLMNYGNHIGEYKEFEKEMEEEAEKLDLYKEKSFG
jgi:hypothetical protein|tara:strand:- start:1312 stop:2076 length:765 start_codon:yes stop_codon:yes gene_type:complete